MTTDAKQVSRKPIEKNQSSSNLSQLKLFGRIGGFGGLVLFVLLTLFSQLKDFKPFFQKMTGNQSYHLLFTFLTLVFAICVLGLVCWVYVGLKKGSLTGTRASLIALLGALVLGGALWSTAHAMPVEPPPAKDKPIQNPTPTPTPAKQTFKRLIGKDFGFAVGGCEGHGQGFSATAPGDLDRSQGGSGGVPGFDLEITGNNGHGVRNVSASGNTISFEAFADGPGTVQGGSFGIPRVCVGGQGANVNVNVYAHVKE